MPDLALGNEVWPAGLLSGSRPPMMGQVERIDGMTMVLRANGALEPLRAQSILAEGDIICVIDGSMTLRLADGSRIDMIATAQSWLRRITTDAEDNLSLTLTAAGGAFSFRPGGPLATVVFETPSATIQPGRTAILFRHSSAHGLMVQRAEAGGGDAAIIVENKLGLAVLVDDAHCIVAAGDTSAPVVTENACESPSEAVLAEEGAAEEPHDHDGMEVSAGMEDGAGGTDPVTTSAPGYFDLVPQAAPLPAGFAVGMASPYQSATASRSQPEEALLQFRTAAVAAEQPASDVRYLSGWTAFKNDWLISDTAEVRGPTPEIGKNGPGALINPTEGSAMAVISGGQDGIGAIDAFFGFAEGELARSAPGTRIADASAIKATLSLRAGSQFSFDWFFDAANLSPRRDTALVVINNQAIKLTDSLQTGLADASGWRTFVYTVPVTGQYTVGFVAMNDLVTQDPSRLIVDNVGVSRVFDARYAQLGGATDGRWRILVEKPVVGDDALTTTESARITVPQAVLLANDQDRFNVLQVQGTDTRNTTGLAYTSVGSVTYDPGGRLEGLALGEIATDSFEYTVGSQRGVSESGTVRVTIIGENDAPRAAPDAAEAPADGTPVSVAVLGNDDDIDSDDNRTTLRIVSAKASSDGSVAFSGASGAGLTYRAGAAFRALGEGEIGIESITYTIEDRHGARSSSVLTVRVAGMNDAPLAADDVASTAANAAVELTVLANDSDPDRNDILRVVGVDGTALVSGQAARLSSGAQVTLAADALVYDPLTAFARLSEGELATDTFRYRISDGHGDFSEASAVVTLQGRNDAPIAAQDAAQTAEDAPLLTVRVLDNDDDLDSDDDTTSLRVVAAQSSAGARITFDGTPGGTLGYDPSGRFEALGLGEVAVDTVSYTIEDRHGARSTGTLLVRIDGANDVPVAGADAFAADEDSRASLPVLANDRDPDARDVLRITAVNGVPMPLGGTVALASGALLSSEPAGTLAYDPNGRFDALAVGATEIDRFFYTISDGQGGTATAEALISISGRNDAPIANADIASASEDESGVSIAVLQNDDDIDSDDDSATLRVVSAQSAAGAQVTITGGATTLRYAPAGKFEFLGVGETATDTVSYVVRDRHSATATGTVTVTIAGSNDGPIAAADAMATSAATVLQLPLTAGILANDRDPDASDRALVVAVNGDAGNVGRTLVLASGALLIVNADGSLTYDPSGKFDALTDSDRAFEAFTYTIRDSHGLSASTTATITVLGRNDAPDAATDEAATDADSAVRINVLANDTDPDAGGNLRVLEVDTQGTRGSVRVNVDGTLTYDPAGRFADLDAGESATDTFRYVVDDTAGGRSTGTVTLTVSGIERPVISAQQIVQTFDSGAVLTGWWGLRGQGTIVNGYNAGASVATATHGETMLQLSASGASAQAIEHYLSTDVLQNGQPLVRLPADSVGGSSAHSGAATRSTLSLSSGDVHQGGVTLSFDWNFISREAQPALTNLNDFAVFTLTDGVKARVFKLAEARDLPAGGATGWRTGVLEVTGVFALPAVGDLRLTIGIAVLNDERPDNASVLLLDNVRLNRPLTGSHELVGSVSSGLFTTYRERPAAADDDLQSVGGAPFSEDQASAFAASLLLANDRRSAGSVATSLTVSALDLSQTLGDASLVSGIITYDPRGRLDGLAEGEIGSDLLRYRVTDSNGGSDVADIVIRVQGRNDVPLAAADVAAVEEDASPQVIDVLANDDDVDSDDDWSSLRVVAAQSASGAAVTFSGAAGAGIVYDLRSVAGYNALAQGETTIDQVTYIIEDRHGAQTTGTVAITITGTNDAPTARDDRVATDQDTAVAVPALANDSDPDTSDVIAVAAIDGTALTAGTRIVLRSGASVVIDTGGAMLYEPGSAFAALSRWKSATDTFTYRITDGHGGTAQASVTVEIAGRNDAPVARADALTTAASTPLTVAATSLLANDTDADAGDGITLLGIEAGSAVGSISFDGSTVVYDPRGRFVGLGEGESAVDTFTYRVVDREGAEAVGTVAVTVRGVNDAPLAVDDIAVTDEDTALTLRVLDNDRDLDANDRPTLLSVDTTGTRGSVAINADGTILYDPNGQFDTLDSGQVGRDTFTYRISDGHGGIDEATVSIDVHGRSDAQRLVDSFETPFATQNRTGAAVTTVSSFQEADGQQGTYMPTDGQYMARLVASGTAAQPIGQETVSRLEGFLGIPNRSLPRDPVDNSFPANGSAFKLKVAVQAGDELSFDWMFDARDFVHAPPDGKTDNDYAVFTVIGQGAAEIFKLSDVRQTGDQSASGWRSSVYTANTAGELTIGYAVVNDRVGDSPSSHNSYLLVDNLRLNREYGEGYQVVETQAAGRFETLILT